MPTAPAVPSALLAAFDAYGAGVRQRLLEVRALIFATAAQTPEIGPLTETLKWSEPAYLTQASGSGSTIRLGRTRSPEGGCAVLFNCRTNLVATFRDYFPDAFVYEGDRAILLDLTTPLSATPLPMCLHLALTYHLAKRRRADGQPRSSLPRHDPLLRGGR